VGEKITEAAMVLCHWQVQRASVRVRIIIIRETLKELQLTRSVFLVVQDWQTTELSFCVSCGFDKFLSVSVVALTNLMCSLMD